MLLLVVQFAILNTDDYFVLVVFQMARSTLCVAWHTVLSVGDCDVHVQMCFD